MMNDDELARNNFKATDIWLCRWKSTFGIKSMRAHGKKDSAVVESAEK
jgi:hypothetical protein